MKAFLLLVFLFTMHQPECMAINFAFALRTKFTSFCPVNVPTKGFQFNVSKLQEQGKMLYLQFSSNPYICRTELCDCVTMKLIDNYPELSCLISEYDISKNQTVEKQLVFTATEDSSFRKVLRTFKNGIADPRDIQSTFIFFTDYSKFFIFWQCDKSFILRKIYIATYETQIPKQVEAHIFSIFPQLNLRQFLSSKKINNNYCSYFTSSKRISNITGSYIFNQTHTKSVATEIMPNVVNIPSIVSGTSIGVIPPPAQTEISNSTVANIPNQISSQHIITPVTSTSMFPESVSYTTISNAMFPNVAGIGAIPSPVDISPEVTNFSVTPAPNQIASEEIITPVMSSQSVPQVMGPNIFMSPNTPGIQNNYMTTSANYSNMLYSRCFVSEISMEMTTDEMKSSSNTISNLPTFSTMQISEDVNKISGIQTNDTTTSADYNNVLYSRCFFSP